MRIVFTKLEQTGPMEEIHEALRDEVHRALAAKNIADMSEAWALEAAMDTVRELHGKNTLSSDWEVEVGNGHLTVFRTSGRVKGTWPLSELCPEFFLVRDVMEE
jgi:hypothetical protein